MEAFTVRLPITAVRGKGARGLTGQKKDAGTIGNEKLEMRNGGAAQKNEAPRNMKRDVTSEAFVSHTLTSWPLVPSYQLLLIPNP